MNYVSHIESIGSLEKCVHTYYSLQFSAEMNTSGSKTLIYFITFHGKYDYGADYQSCGSLHNIVTP